MRFEDWPSRLSDFVEAASGRPFSWGSADCCLFAADWVREATGVDPAARHRGRYRTAKEASRLLRRLGGSVEAIATAVLGPPLASPLLAQRGDIALVDGVLGITIGGEVALLSEAGLSLHPLTSASKAWRIE